MRMELHAVSFLLYATALLFFGIGKAAQSSPGVHLTAYPPWSAVFPGETVTLTCQVIGSEGWTFYWIRHTQEGQTPFLGSRSDGSEVVLDAVKERESGMYQCVTAKGNDQAFSNFHNITVSATRPQAVVVTEPPASVMFTGETVTLACDIRKGSGWRYSWMRITQGILQHLRSLSSESQQKLIFSIRESNSGEYFCQGDRGQDPVFWSLTGSLVLNVSGGKPKPVITQNASGEMYTGDSVTLSCGFGGDPAGWEYFWYKDTQRTALPNTESSRSEGSSYSISPAALAHSGAYRCRAARGITPFYSDYSDPMTLEISGPRPQAVVVTDPPASVMFTGETVTLACDINKASDWRYSWTRITQGILEPLGVRSTESQKHVLHSARESDSGEYRCWGDQGQNPVIQSSPGSLVLNVSGGKPKPVITQNASGEMYTGGSVTLSCGFGGDPAGWEYSWYKDTQRTALPNTESSRSEGSSYSISPAALAHSGAYRCRAARGITPFYSDYSDPLTLEISVPRAVENVARICVGAGVLLFLSVIASPAFWRRVSGQGVVHSEEEMAEHTADA